MRSDFCQVASTINNNNEVNALQNSVYAKICDVTLLAELISIVNFTKVFLITTFATIV